MSMKPLTVTTMIAELQAVLAEHGDLTIYHVDSRSDSAQEVYCTEVDENSHWEGAPEEKAVYLS
jgi:hypothetical protein